MSEPFITVWTQSAALPSSASTIFGLLLIAAALFAFAVLRSRKSRRSSAGDGEQPSRALFYVGAVPLAAAILVAALAVPRWLQLRSTIAASGVQVTEGTVQTNRTWLRTSSRNSPSTRMYSIEVNGKRFEWAESSGERYDALVENKGGGILRVNKRVRVNYVPLNGRNELIAIEAENLCRLYPKCSGFTVFSWRWETKK